MNSAVIIAHKLLPQAGGDGAGDGAGASATALWAAATSTQLNRTQ